MHSIRFGCASEADYNKVHVNAPFIVVQLALGLANVQIKCYAATPFVAATERCMGRWQLAFNSLVFMFSLMLLPGLWHRHDCLVEKQPAVES